MKTLFTKVLGMSFTAGLVIAAVCVARLILRKAPKKVSYLLWAVVLFRLLCPLSIPSPFSFLPQETTAQTVVSRWSDTVIAEVRQESLPVITVTEPVSQPLPVKEPIAVSVSTPVKAEKATLPLPVVLWVSGMGCFAVYSLASLRNLRRKIGIPIRLRNNIYYGEAIRSPFILGILFPRIYLPSNLSESEREYVIAHEQFHVRHGDHLVKLLFFAALCIHWFNPMVWLAFILFSQDMEMRCDEAIVSKMNSDKRADYCASLLNLAVRSQLPAGFPLSFGGSNTMRRIKNLAAIKKTGVGFVALTLVFSIVLSACLATDPKGMDKNASETNSNFGTKQELEQVKLDLDISNQEMDAVLEALQKEEMYAELEKQNADKAFLNEWKHRYPEHIRLDAAFASDKGKFFNTTPTFRYKGGSMSLKIRLATSGISEVGLLLFLDGSPLPYSVKEDTTPSYMKIFDRSNESEFFVDVTFTPNTGSVGDCLNLTVVPIANPNFTLADAPALCQFTHASRSGSAKLEFLENTPESELTVIPNRILSLEERISEPTEGDLIYLEENTVLAEPYFPYTFSVNKGNSHYPHYGKGTIDVYHTDFSEPATVTLSLFGDEVGEYSFVLFVNNQPVTTDALWEIHPESGNKQTFTATIDVSDCAEEAVIYGVLIAKNYVGYYDLTGAAQNVIATPAFILSSANNIYEILGVSEPN